MVQKNAEKPPTIEIPPTNYPWVDSPFFEQLFEQSNLDEKTQKIIKQFAEDGYAIVDDLGIENIEERSDKIIEDLQPRYGDKGKVEEYWIYHDRIQDAWRFNEDVKKIAIAPNILSLLKTLYQREPIPFQTLNFRKGTEQSTHSDIIHFSSMPLRFMCGVWVALEDIDLNNGPLHYYPGSHKLPIIDLQDLGITGSYQNKPYQVYKIYEEFLQSLIEAKGLKKHTLSVKKGQALIWAANLLHGGEPILDPKRSRHSQVTHYYFADCMYHTPLLSDPFLHRIHFKKVRNVITGEILPHIYNGEKIEVCSEEYETERLQYLFLQAQTELEKVRPKLLESEAELSKLKPQLKAVEEELEKLRSQFYKFKSEAEELRPQRKLWEEELEKLRSQLYQCLAEAKELQIKVEQDEAELIKSRSQRKDLEAELKQLKAEKEGWQVELKKARVAGEEKGEELEKMRVKLQETEAELEELGVAKEGMEAELKMLRPQLEKAAAELQKLQPQLVEVEAELEELKVEKEAADLELEKLRPQLKKAEAELEELKVEKEAADLELEKLRPQLEETVKDKEELQAKLKEADAEREKLAPQLREANKELELLRASMSEATEELEFLRPQMQKTRAELDELSPRSSQAEFLLEQYKSKVEAMESSKFWKLRGKWLRVKKMFGLSGE